MLSWCSNEPGYILVLQARVKTLGEEYSVSEKTYAVSIFINAPFDSVWAWVSDPSKFPSIYPSWIRWVKRLQRADGEAYEGVAQHGGSIEIVPSLARERGRADFEIVNEDGNIEVFQAFLVSIRGEGQNTSTSLRYRWEGVDDPFIAGLKL